MKNITSRCFFIFFISLKLVSTVARSTSVKYYSNHVSDGSYEFSFSHSDGQTRQEKGVLVAIDGAKVYEVTGSYSFKGTDGKSYLVEYTAGVGGYKATVTATPERFHSIAPLISPLLIQTLIG